MMILIGTLRVKKDLGYVSNLQQEEFCYLDIFFGIINIIIISPGIGLWKSLLFQKNGP
jgi:hypothetical protein